jgi:hypothetical protein
MSSRAKRSRPAGFRHLPQQGIYKQRDPEGHHVAYKAFREDPQAIR